MTYSNRQLQQQDLNKQMDETDINTNKKTNSHYNLMGVKSNPVEENQVNFKKQNENKDLSKNQVGKNQQDEGFCRKNYKKFILASVFFVFSIFVLLGVGYYIKLRNKTNSYQIKGHPWAIVLPSGQVIKLIQLKSSNTTCSKIICQVKLKPHQERRLLQNQNQTSSLIHLIYEQVGTVATVANDSITIRVKDISQQQLKQALRVFNNTNEVTTKSVEYNVYKYNKQQNKYQLQQGKVSKNLRRLLYEARIDFKKILDEAKYINSTLQPKDINKGNKQNMDIALGPTYNNGSAKQLQDNCFPTNNQQIQCKTNTNKNQSSTINKPRSWQIKFNLKAQ